jgi:hypothetical protein
MCDVVAADFCQILLLYKQDFDVALGEWVLAKKQESTALLRTIEVVREWNLLKIGAFLDDLHEITYPCGRTIYQVGDPSEDIYIVKRGRVQMEIFFLVETQISLPETLTTYQTKRTVSVVARTLRTIGRG